METEYVLRILQQEVAAAKRTVDDAARNFDAVISDVPSGLPRSDGVERIRSASRALGSARQRLAHAHQELTEFLAEGTVPNRVKEEARRKENPG